MPADGGPSQIVRGPSQGRTGAWSFVVGVFAFIAVTLALPLGATAILSGAGRVRLPYELVLLDQKLPTVFRIHMAASGLALILIVLALMLRHRPSLHRWVGRVAAVAVVAGGLTALPSALMSEASGYARAAFFAQGCVWLGLLGTGYAAIRRRNVVRHRTAMLAMAAVASGAIWLRIAMLAVAGFELPFDAAYVVAAWACWIVPLAVTLIAVAKQNPRRALRVFV